eukprot:TRINITY_DN2694_c0_g1_i34.p1 TRINITY_DN2694_c0_g1~~TRINITY_DN2694_c0_g1_i34.p1  ORF type:complete len:183 (-),score=29.88 TRINITY_DN2694_c0_g1_i34:382-930(-)
MVILVPARCSGVVQGSCDWCRNTWDKFGQDGEYVWQPDHLPRAVHMCTTCPDHALCESCLKKLQDGDTVPENRSGGEVWTCAPTHETVAIRSAAHSLEVFGRWAFELVQRADGFVHAEDLLDVLGGEEPLYNTTELLLHDRSDKLDLAEFLGLILEIYSGGEIDETDLGVIFDKLKAQQSFT